MARKVLKYFRVEFEVKTEGLPVRDRGSYDSIEKRVEVILADPSNVKEYADVNAEARSLFPGQCTFNGKYELAKDYNDITMVGSGESGKEGFLEKLFRLCFG